MPNHAIANAYSSPTESTDDADLEAFIVEAKAASYVGGKARALSSRLGSHDIAHARNGWSYLDSYFGGTDFLGQETVWQDGTPVWAMNYYGRVLDHDAIDAARAGGVIRQALTALYRQGRFLGGISTACGDYRYVDENRGSVSGFSGVEHIEWRGWPVYRLDYHGGRVVP